MSKKLYEFKLRKGKLESLEYEVKETEKQYKILQGYTTYNCLSRISKDLIGKALNGGYFGISCILTEDNVEIAKNILIHYWENTKIPSCEKGVQIANEELKKAKEELAYLKKLK